MTVRRARRLPVEDLAPYLLDVPDGSGPLDWQTVFGNAGPVEIEVGFGKGLFLLNAGVSQQNKNFFGIEIVRKYQLYAATRYAIRNMPNVKTACADAKVVLRDFVPPASVADSSG